MRISILNNNYTNNYKRVNNYKPVYLTRNNTIFKSSKEQSLNKQDNVLSKIKSFFIKHIKTYIINTPKTEKESIKFSNSDQLKILQKSLNKLKNFSISEYNTLNQEDLTILREIYEKIADSDEGYITGKISKYDDFYNISFKEIDLAHDRAVDLIKSTLDSKYGKNKYAVIIIGRSLASIGKCLGYRIGEKNVTNIPLSSADKYKVPEKINSLKKNGNLFILKKFLKNIGLTKRKIENSNKKYILMDYCFSGESLKGAENLLTNKHLLGRHNIEAMDVKNCIPDKVFQNYLTDTLCDSKFKELSLISTCYNLKKIPHSFVNTNNLNCKIKLVLFHLLDNQMKKIKL